MPDDDFRSSRGGALQRVAPVVEQVRLARDTYRLRLAAPELAQRVTPGQFFMIRAPGVTSPLLGRPFALYDTWLDDARQPAGIDVVYLVVGRMTALMSTWQRGDRAEIWGPLGNGFPPPNAERLLMVAGGIGNTPFPAVAREALGLRTYGRSSCQPGATVAEPPACTSGSRSADPTSPSPSLPLSFSPPLSLSPDRITFCYGARSAEYLAGLEDFAGLGIDVRLATDDGTRGHRGFVTDLAERWLRELAPTRHGATDQAGDRATAHQYEPFPAAIYCCGPEPMMHAVAALAARYAVPCWLSLETPMACGFGACFSCVTRVNLPEGGWDYRRVCVEGPIFAAESLTY